MHALKLLPLLALLIGCQSTSPPSARTWDVLRRSRQLRSMATKWPTSSVVPATP